MSFNSNVPTIDLTGESSSDSEVENPTTNNVLNNNNTTSFFTNTSTTLNSSQTFQFGTTNNNNGGFNFFGNTNSSLDSQNNSFTPFTQLSTSSETSNSSKRNKTEDNSTSDGETESDKTDKEPKRTKIHSKTSDFKTNHKRELHISKKDGQHRIADITKVKSHWTSFAHNPQLQKHTLFSGPADSDKQFIDPTIKFIEYTNFSKAHIQLMEQYHDNLEKIQDQCPIKACRHSSDNEELYLSKLISFTDNYSSVLDNINADKEESDDDQNLTEKYSKTLIDQYKRYFSLIKYRLDSKSFPANWFHQWYHNYPNDFSKQLIQTIQTENDVPEFVIEQIIPRLIFHRDISSASIILNLVKSDIASCIRAILSQYPDPSSYENSSYQQSFSQWKEFCQNIKAQFDKSNPTPPKTALYTLLKLFASPIENTQAGSETNLKLIEKLTTCWEEGIGAILYYSRPEISNTSLGSITKLAQKNIVRPNRPIFTLDYATSSLLRNDWIQSLKICAEHNLSISLHITDLVYRRSLLNDKWTKDASFNRAEFNDFRQQLAQKYFIDELTYYPIEHEIAFSYLRLGGKHCETAFNEILSHMTASQLETLPKFDKDFNLDFAYRQLIEKNLGDRYFHQKDYVHALQHFYSSRDEEHMFKVIKNMFHSEFILQQGDYISQLKDHFPDTPELVAQAPYLACTVYFSHFVHHVKTKDYSDALLYLNFIISQPIIPLFIIPTTFDLFKPWLQDENIRIPNQLASSFIFLINSILTNIDLQNEVFQFTQNSKRVITLHEFQTWIRFFKSCLTNYQSNHTPKIMKIHPKLVKFNTN